MKERKEKCHNGLNWRYQKENRCNFEHGNSGEDDWKKVQHRRQGRQHKQPNHQKQQQKKIQQPVLHRQTLQNEQTKDECRNGPSCIFLKHNKCNFFHQHSGQRRPSSSQQANPGAKKQGGPSNPLRPCKFGNTCSKGIRCTFLHLPKDFLPQQGGRRN